MRRQGFALVVLALLVLGCDKTYDVERIEPPGVQPVPIEVPTDEKSEVGWYPALRLGPDGTLHIAYCDRSRGDLRYGHRDHSGLLKLESAAEEGAVGKYIALAVDATHTPHILYYNQDTKYLMYTVRTAGTWQHEKVAWGPELGMGSRMVVHEGKVFAIFYDHQEHLRLARRVRITEKPIGADGAWKVEQVDRAGGSWTIWTDLAVEGDKLVASYPHWNFVDSELRLAEMPLAGGDWTPRVVFPMKKSTPGWMSDLVVEPDGLHLAFTEIRRERVYYGKVPDHGDMTDAPVVGYYLNRMRAAVAPNGDLVMAVAETGKGRLGNSTLAIIRRHNGKWTRYTVDTRRPVGSQLDVAAGPNGEAIVLYFAHSSRGLWLYDESTKTTVEGARKSPTPEELEAGATSQTATTQPATSQPASAPAK